MFTAPFALMSSQEYNLPVDFLARWNPSNFKIYENNGSFSTDLNFNSLRPTGLTSWIAKTGNDTTGDGSQGNPYRTIEKARAVGTIVYMIKTGHYNRADNISAANWTPTVSQAFIAADGPGTVTLSRAYDSLSWVQQSSPNTNVYLATAATLEFVIDAANPQTGTINGVAKTLADGVTGVPKNMVSVADIATCQATPNSYFYSGTNLYVHTFNDRAPDANVIVLSTEGFIWFTTGTNNTLYYEGINMYGRRFGRTEHTTANTCTFAMLNCNGHFSIESSMAPVRIQGTKNVYVKNCKFSDFTLADLCSLSMGNTATQVAAPNGLFENITAWNTGSGTNNNYNCFTGHYGANAIILNCRGDSSFGPQYAFVLGAFVFVAGCYGTTSLTTVVSGQKSIYLSGGVNDVDNVTPTKMWLLKSTAAGNNNYARVRTGTLSTDAYLFDMGGFVNLTTGTPNGDSGTITPYP